MRLITNNDQQKVENKQRIVEKAMITYAETDSKKSPCTMMTVQQLIDNGYIKDVDNLGIYDNKEKQWYYYGGEIRESLPENTSCTIVASNTSSNIDNEGEVEVTVYAYVS